MTALLMADTQQAQGRWSHMQVQMHLKTVLSTTCTFSAPSALTQLQAEDGMICNIAYDRQVPINMDAGSIPLSQM